MPIISEEDIVIETSTSHPVIVPDMRVDIPITASPSSNSSTHSPVPYQTAVGNSATSPAGAISPADYCASVLASGQTEIVYNSETHNHVSETISPISSSDVLSEPESSISVSSVNCNTSTETTESEAGTNGVTKKITKALNEKLLKKLSQQTMVHHNINAACGLHSSQNNVNLNSYAHDALHMNVKSYIAKEEAIMTSCGYLNPNIGSELDNGHTVSLPALSSTLSNTVSECPVTLPMDTLAMTLPQIVSSPEDVDPSQQPVYSYQGGVAVQPVQVVQNIHTTYQTNVQTAQHGNQHATPARQHSYPGYNFSGNTNNGVYMGYQYSDTSPTDSTPDRDVMLERYIQQQQQQQYYAEHSAHAYTYGISGMKENGNYAMKSPDSGFQEPCSPTENKTLVNIFYFSINKKKSDHFK